MLNVLWHYGFRLGGHQADFEQESEQLCSQENARGETAQLRERLLARKTAQRAD